MLAEQEVEKEEDVDDDDGGNERMFAFIIEHPKQTTSDTATR